MTVLQFVLTASFTHCEDVFGCLMQTGRFIRRQGAAIHTAYLRAQEAPLQVRRANPHFCHLDAHLAAWMWWESRLLIWQILPQAGGPESAGCLQYRSWQTWGIPGTDGSAGPKGNACLLWGRTWAQALLKTSIKKGRTWSWAAAGRCSIQGGRSPGTGWLSPLHSLAWLHHPGRSRPLPLTSRSFWGSKVVHKWQSVIVTNRLHRTNGMEPPHHLCLMCEGWGAGIHVLTPTSTHPLTQNHIWTFFLLKTRNASLIELTEKGTASYEKHITSIFFFLLLHCTAYGIWVPQPGIEPVPPAVGS